MKNYPVPRGKVPISNRFEVLIVGTGPAGAAAANVLAEAGGLKIALVDKAHLPRPKACGGIFPHRLQKKLGGLSGLAIESEYHSFNFSNRGGATVSHQGHLLGVDRSAFDSALVQRAISEARGSIALVEGFQVERLELGANFVSIVDRSGATLQGDVLIGADGAFSRIARLAGLNAGNVVRPAIDLEVAVPLDDMAQLGDTLSIDLFEANDGYGWIFPKADRLSCGILNWSGKTNLNAALESYLDRRLPSGWKTISRMGHGLPIYSTRKEIARGRIMLAGDAANLAEPIYGAGIEAAVESGVLAGRAARSICAGDDTPEAIAGAYQSEVHRTIGDPIAAVFRHISPIFREKPDFFYRNFVAGEFGHEAFAARLTGLSQERAATHPASGLFS